MKPYISRFSPPGPPTVSKFKSVLLVIANELVKSDLDAMKFLLSDQISEGDFENVDKATDLFLVMERTGFLSEGSLDLLITLLHKTNREDLVRQLAEHERSRNTFSSGTKTNSYNGPPSSIDPVPPVGLDSRQTPRPPRGENRSPDTSTRTTGDLQSPQPCTDDAGDDLRPLQPSDSSNSLTVGNTVPLPRTYCRPDNQPSTISTDGAAPAHVESAEDQMYDTGKAMTTMLMSHRPGNFDSSAAPAPRLRLKPKLPECLDSHYKEVSENFVEIERYRVHIKPGRHFKFEDEEFVHLISGEHFAVELENLTSLRCAADIAVEGEKVINGLEIDIGQKVSIDRPQDINLKFVFIRASEAPAEAGIDDDNESTGLVSVTFYPELVPPTAEDSEDNEILPNDGLGSPDRGMNINEFVQGGAALSDESATLFQEINAVFDIDVSAATRVELRLVARRDMKSQPITTPIVPIKQNKRPRMLGKN